MASLPFDGLDDLMFKFYKEVCIFFYCCNICLFFSHFSIADAGFEAPDN